MITRLPPTFQTLGVLGAAAEGLADDQYAVDPSFRLAGLTVKLHIGAPITTISAARKFLQRAPRWLPTPGVSFPPVAAPARHAGQMVAVRWEEDRDRDRD